MTIQGYQLLALTALGFLAYTHAVCNLMIGCGDCVEPEPYCAKCEDGKFPGNDTDKNKCFECTGNCTTCESATTCKTSKPYYILRTNGTCEVENQTSSTDCKDGQTCDWCFTNCAGCNNESTCWGCSTGYFLDNEIPNVCTSCSNNTGDASGLANCVKCADTTGSADTYCLDCATGFSPKADGSECLACVLDNCDECVYTASKCSRCNAGFFLDPTLKTCLQECSVANCKLCDTATTCNICASGYYDTTFTNCDACKDSNCKTCTAADTTGKCSSCNSGFARTAAQTCVSCPSHCVMNYLGCSESTTASGTAVCTVCEPGYQSMDGACVECPANCAMCIVNATTGETVGQCRQCNTGYWLKGGGCPANCDDCALERGVLVCTVCAAGYTKDFNNDCEIP